MFCDLVDSIPLSRRLDPEDYREVVRAYQAACAEVIQRFDGHIAQYLGDGLLVYFGYPLAHEDDVQRAVRAGLGAIAAVEALNPHLERDKGVRLAIRVGIHTGLVVVGEIGAAGRHEQLALGETPNVAARLQGLPTPNTVAISAASYHLVQGYFVCDDLGAHTFKGVETPLQVYRIVEESGAQSRLDVASHRGLTPLVGREAEVTLLLDHWAQVTESLGQVVLLSGEGGIGKSRLVQVLKDHVGNAPHARFECRCSPYHTNSAFYPVIDLWQRVLRFATGEAPADKLHKLEQMLAQYRLPLAETVPLFAALLSLPLPDGPYPPLALTPQRQKQKTLEALLALLVERAAQEPVLFIVEDLHWVDPSTLEFLSLLVDQGPTARICALCTFRPQFTPPWSPRAHIAQLTLTRLRRLQLERMITAVAGGKALPAAVVQQIVTKSDGVPLFVEEMTKSGLGLGTAPGARGSLRIDRSTAPPGNSGHASGRPHGAPGPTRFGESGGPTGSYPRARVCLRVAAGGVAHGRAGAMARPGAACAGRGTLPARRAAAGHLPVQACPDSRMRPISRSSRARGSSITSGLRRC